MKKQLPGWAVLLIITLVAGLALGGTYALTKEPIAEQALLQAENARRAALPDADTFETLTLTEDASVDWANAGLKTVKGKAVPLTLEDIDAIAGATVTSTAVVNAINAAYEQYKAAPSDAAFTGEAQGFASPVAVEATFDGDTIATLKIGDDRFAETPGLGARALEEEFQDQFVGGEKVIGYVSQITVKGYKGPVEVTVGLDSDLVLTGISVGGSDFAETAGLGAKAKEPAFTSQFAGKKTPVSVIKTGGTPGDNTVDAITAATITSNAVRDGVNGVVKYVKKDILGIADIEMPARPEDDSMVFSAKERGFASNVYVEASFDAEGKITYIGIGDEEFGETAGYGAAALEAENQYPFIGAQMPLELGDVDTLTGATFTKTAIVNALNAAYSASQGVELPAPAPKEEITLPEKPTDGVFSASEQGFAGPVYVEAAFDDAGTITYIHVGDDAFAETEGFGARALEDENKAALIGKQMPLALEDVDILTGATFTKTAIVNGLNKAYNASQGITEEPAAEEPAAEAKTMPEKPEVTYKADADGFASPVAVEAAFDGDTVAWISIGDKRFDETAGFGARALEPETALALLGVKVPVDAADVDILTGATFTKTALITALNKAYEKSKSAGDEPIAEEPAAEVKTMPEKPEVTFKADADGFASPVAVEAAFDGDTVAWIGIGDKRFDETAGFGARALEPETALALLGVKVPVDAADVDILTGATFTKTALITALNKAYEKAQAAAAEAEAEALAGETAAAAVTGEAEGFGGPVAVEVAFDGDTITALTVGDSRFAETPGLGARAQEEDFQAQFIGKKAPLALSDIDAIAGATITSTAVVNAINAAYDAAQAATKEATEPVAEEAPAAPAPASSGSDNALTGEAIAFFTTYKAEATFQGGRIETLALYEKQAGSDEYAPLAQEEAFRAALIGQEVPLDESSLTVEGAADYVKTAVVLAVNQAYAQGAPVSAAAQNKTYVGECVIFFTVIRAEATFGDGALTGLRLTEKPVGEGAEFAALPQEEAFQATLIGRAVPLDETDIPVDGAAEYIKTAVVIAVNQAYAQFLTGQQ